MHPNFRKRERQLAYAARRALESLQWLDGELGNLDMENNVVELLQEALRPYALLAPGAAPASDTEEGLEK